MLTIKTTPIGDPLILEYQDVKPGQILQTLYCDFNTNLQGRRHVPDVFKIKTLDGGWVLIQSPNEDQAVTGYYAKKRDIKPNLLVVIYESKLTPQTEGKPPC